jgi:hypothetical protein
LTPAPQKLPAGCQVPPMAWDARFYVGPAQVSPY